MKVSLITWVWVKMESTTDYLFLLIVSISERLFSETMDNIRIQDDAFIIACTSIKKGSWLTRNLS